MFSLVLNILITLAVLVSAVHRRVERVPGSCARCKYSLSGLPRAGTCPECGNPYDESPFELRLLRVRRRSPRVLLATFPAALLYYVVISRGMLGFTLKPVFGSAWYLSLRPVDEREMFATGAVIAVSPLCAALGRERRPMTLFFIALTLAAAADILRLSVHGWWI